MRLKFSAWMTHWNEASLASFEANAKWMARVYPVWYLTSEAGLPFRRPDAKPELRARVRAAAQAHGVEVWPLISNHSAAKADFDPAVMRLLMGDPAIRKAHIATLLRLVQEDGAQGVDLDYENLYDGDGAAFSAFVEELAAAFHGAGLKVGIAVHAKDAEPGGPGGSRAQDYARLAAACDRLQIMGYDYHWSDGEPGPIGPPQWVASVLKHAKTLVPAAKLELGVPFYGNDWGGGKRAVGTHWPRWTELVKAHGPERRDPATAELTIQYDGREVWMNDAHALAAKLRVAREAGVGEAAAWVLGAEDPRVWALIENLPEEFV